MADRNLLTVLLIRSLLGVAVFHGCTSTGLAVTPFSPEVKQLVNKGLAYLEKSEDSRLGARCLAGLAFLKSHPPQPNHPRVKAALDACRAASRQGNVTNIDVYSNGLAVIFLCEYVPRKETSLIDFYLNLLTKRQKGHGGWGYETKPTGDTSQSQYAALSYWEAHNNGYLIRPESAQGLTDWLMSTQDPTGAWGYQGHVAVGGNLVEQEEITCSMVAAAMGSSLICADLFGYLSNSNLQDASSQPLPDVLRVPGHKERKRAPSLRSPSLDRDRLFEAIERGNKWMEKNYQPDIGRYNVYYLYSLERYKSFQEVLDGFSPDEPDWYQKGYEYLKSSQNGDGSWSRGCGPGPDTALGILFLVRSTKQLLKPEPLIDLRVGRRGLPKAAENVELVGGEFVVQQTEAAVSELLNTLDGDAAEKIDALADSPTALTVVGDIDESAAQRLRQIVRSGSPAARLIATRTLSRTGDLDHVPTLIYALTDPDQRVVIQARDGLRFISRRFEGFGLKENYDEKQRYNAVNKWKDWYLSIRPDAIVTIN